MLLKHKWIDPNGHTSESYESANITPLPESPLLNKTPDHDDDLMEMNQEFGLEGDMMAGEVVHILNSQGRVSNGAFFDN